MTLSPLAVAALGLALMPLQPLAVATDGFIVADATPPAIDGFRGHAVVGDAAPYAVTVSDSSSCRG